VILPGVAAFGLGIHRCIGSNLARLELRATFEEFLKRIPEYRVVEERESLDS